MSRLTWGADSDRIYEAGVDRGVLYIAGQPGVPWNGLKSVVENPSGGSPEPYYLDGLKYANVATAEEFNATLEAYSSPIEFAPCDGSVQLASGLFATQQPRKSFGLSYRTKVGDGISGLGVGHKIHLVYNALAEPSSRANNSQGQSTTPLALSWSISTRPPVGIGYKPTAHLVIDTREISSILLAELEVILYGDEATVPSLPSQSDLIELLS